jgi:large subunit ribosomal protein L10
MSKVVKKMEMDALKKTFGDLRDLVLLNVSGLPALTENTMRLQLRQKNVRLHTVKNSLAARVFKEIGINGLEEHLKGPTTVAWGSSSIADLSKAIDAIAAKEKKVQPKIAVADGVIVTFAAAKKFPTREEAIARVVTLAMSPARRIAGQIRGPAGKIASQVKTISEKKEEGAAAPA